MAINVLPGLTRAQVNTGSISGTVLDDTGAPAAGYRVFALEQPGLTLRGAAFVGTDGTYSIDGLVVGTKHVVLFENRDLDTLHNFKIESGVTP